MNKIYTIILFTCLFLTACTVEKAEEVVIEEKSETILGYETNGFLVYQDVVKKNEFLADILGGCNVEYAKVHKLVQNSKDKFDVRDLKAGRQYTVFSDSLNNPQFFLYEQDPVNFVVFDFSDTLGVNVKSREVEIEIAEASGIIEESLYLTLDEQGLSPRLAIELADVYAWSVDFFHILKGDWFKVVYEKRYVDGEFIGVGEIKTAVFNHHKQDYYAFLYKNEELPAGQGYFDDQCNTLEKAFLRAPLKFSRISSRYSKRRFHPVQKRWKPHLGTDYAAPKGTPIMSTANGTVVAKGYTRGNGNYVKVKHNSVYTTQYLHMSKFAKGVNKGTRVKQGQTIGYVGKTGLATGNHVCYRFWKNGVQVDALKQKLPPAKPISPELQPEYEVLKDSLMLVLDKIGFPPPKPKIEPETEEVNDSLVTMKN